MVTPVLVFDGECGLCNRFVAFVVRHDREGKLLLTGSASPVAREIVKRGGLESDVTDRSTVVWTGSRALHGTTALALTFSRLPYPWRAFSWLRAVPRPARDALYRFLAARRPRVYAEDPACGVPPVELLARWRARLATLDDL